MRANIGKALTVIVGNVVEGSNTEVSYCLHYKLSPSVIFVWGRGLKGRSGKHSFGQVIQPSEV
jgi:hypothetical protein